MVLRPVVCPTALAGPDGERWLYVRPNFRGYRELRAHLTCEDCMGLAQLVSDVADQDEEGGTAVVPRRAKGSVRCGPSPSPLSCRVRERLVGRWSVARIIRAPRSAAGSGRGPLIVKAEASALLPDSRSASARWQTGRLRAVPFRFWVKREFSWL